MNSFARTLANEVVQAMSESEMGRKTKELDRLREYYMTISRADRHYLQYCSICCMPRLPTAPKPLQCVYCDVQLQSCGSVYCKSLDLTRDPARSCPLCIDKNVTNMCPSHKLTQGACDICGIELCAGCYLIHPNKVHRHRDDITTPIICSAECVAQVAHGKMKKKKV